MDKTLAAHTIINAALPHIPFEGWSMRALMQGALDAGYKKTDVIRVFPGGAVDAVLMHSTLADAHLEANLKNYHLESMKIRDRITLAVRLRLEPHAAHKEAVRRGLQLLMFPLNLHHAAQALYHTVDTIWYAVGDNSTDFNFYTKRATLAAVFSATLTFWVNDESPAHAATWEFLDRRIAEVMKIETFKWKLRQVMA